MKLKMAGATATKFRKNDTAQLAVAIYIFIQSCIHYETIHMLINNQVMLTSWTSLFNVHNDIKQTYVTVYCQAKILLNVLKYLDVSVRHRPQ